MVDGVEGSGQVKQAERKELRAHVIQSGVTTLSGLVEAARIAKIAAGDSSTSTTPDGPLLGQLLDEMSASRRAAEQNTTEIQRLASRLASSTVSARILHHNMLTLPIKNGKSKSMSPSASSITSQSDFTYNNCHKR